MVGGTLLLYFTLRISKNSSSMWLRPFLPYFLDSVISSFSLFFFLISALYFGDFKEIRRTEQNVSTSVNYLAYPLKLFALERYEPYVVEDDQKLGPSSHFMVLMLFKRKKTPNFEILCEALDQAKKILSPKKCFDVYVPIYILILLDLLFYLVFGDSLHGLRKGGRGKREGRKSCEWGYRRLRWQRSPSW